MTWNLSRLPQKTKFGLLYFHQLQTPKKETTRTPSTTNRSPACLPSLLTCLTACLSACLYASLCLLLDRQGAAPQGVKPTHSHPISIHPHMLCYHGNLAVRPQRESEEEEMRRGEEGEVMGNVWRKKKTGGWSRRWEEEDRRSGLKGAPFTCTIILAVAQLHSEGCKVWI